jgi:diadenosine tetraphosphate (Ap4A) HIT family hydrolase
VTAVDATQVASSRDDCELCRRVREGDPSLTVIDTPVWRVFLNEQFPAPGLVWVCAKEHVEGLWALTDEQAASWAVVLRQTAQAMRAALAAERVYVAHFGENHPHFHAVLLNRSAGQESPAEKGVSLLAATLAAKSAPDAADAAAAARSAHALRAHLP